jgi:hypothetical protein
MRVLFASTHKHLPELRGGMEINTHQLATRLAKHGVTIGVLAGLMGRGLVGIGAKLQLKLFGRRWSHDGGPRRSRRAARPSPGSAGIM